MPLLRPFTCSFPELGPPCNQSEDDKTVILEMLPDKIDFGTDLDSPTNLLGSVLTIADMITNKGMVRPPKVHSASWSPPVYLTLQPALVNLKTQSLLTITHVTTVTYLTQMPGSGDMTRMEVLTNVVTHDRRFLTSTIPPSVTAKVMPLPYLLGNPQQ